MNYLPPETLSQDIVTDIYTNDASYVYFDKENGFDYYKDVSTDGVLANAKYTDLNGTDHTLTSTSQVRRESTEAPLDCLLFTNDTDGMLCVWTPLNDDNELHIGGTE